MGSFVGMMCKSIVTMFGMKVVRTAFKGTFETECFFKKHKLHICPNCGEVYSGEITYCEECGEEVEKLYDEKSYGTLNGLGLSLIDDDL